MQQSNPVVVEHEATPWKVPSAPGSGERYRLAFHGTGSALFVLILKTLLLTLVTLGIYAPWAKTARRKFVWQNIELHGQRLHYHGTGRELFIGYLKVAVGYLLFFVVPAVVRQVSPMGGAILQITLALALLGAIPFAVYWSRAYLLSRTSWRGLRFSLVPGAGPFVRVFVVGYLLTLLTLGLYAPVWLNRVHAAVMNRTRFGDTSFRYVGEDAVVWGMAIRGWFLSVITLGIYYFWYRADMTRYQLENTYFGNARGRSDLRGGELFRLGLLYMFGTTLSLGLAFPWIACHTFRALLERCSLEGQIDFPRIAQVEAVGDAAGDGLADAMDVGLSL